MRKKEYIKPLIEEVALDATSVLLTSSQEPPTSGSEDDNENENGDDDIVIQLNGNVSVGASNSIWNLTTPF